MSPRGLLVSTSPVVGLQSHNYFLMEVLGTGFRSSHLCGKHLHN